MLSCRYKIIGHDLEAMEYAAISSKGVDVLILARINHRSTSPGTCHTCSGPVLVAQVRKMSMPWTLAAISALEKGACGGCGGSVAPRAAASGRSSHPTAAFERPFYALGMPAADIR